MNHIREITARSIGRGLAAAALGALGYGTWAVLANVSHGVARGLRAGLTQCAITFTLTLTITLLMEALHQRFHRPTTRVAAAALGSLLTATSCSLLLHTLLGTPEILRTVLPLCILGGVFSLAYALNLELQRPVAGSAA